MRVVSVTGWGLRVPGASTADQLWKLLERVGCAGEVERFPGLPFREDLVVARSEYDECGSLADRSTGLGAACVRDALAGHPRYDDIPPARRAVVVGTAFGPLGSIIDSAQAVATNGLKAVGPRTVPRLMANGLASQITLQHDCRGLSHTLFTACASGTDALGYGVSLLQGGAADLAIVCGTDAPLRADILAGFQRLGALSSETENPALACRPFDAERTGFIMGEGASCLVLEVGLQPDRLGTIRAYAATSDAHHVVAPRPDGTSAAAALRTALQVARLSPTDIGHVNAHGTGTTLNDLAECLAISSVLGATIPTWSLKGAIGHLMGAAGTTEAIASLLALRAQYVPATAGLKQPDPALPAVDLVHAKGRPSAKEHALSTSFAFGGHNSCVVLGL
jgi:3-oxoacyl-[acyl-carrier-protein] synthase II